jgi:hypothetical protein
MSLLKRLANGIYPKCEHKVVLLNSITGDPLKRVYKCVKCGGKAVVDLTERK